MPGIGYAVGVPFQRGGSWWSWLQSIRAIITENNFAIITEDGKYIVQEDIVKSFHIEEIVEQVFVPEVVIEKISMWRRIKQWFIRLFRWLM